MSFYRNEGEKIINTYSAVEVYLITDDSVVHHSPVPKTEKADIIAGIHIRNSFNELVKQRVRTPMES